MTLAVRAPGSTANLGAGFDVLGMALDLYADVGLGVPPVGASALAAEHPALRPYRDLGGRSEEVWVRTNIPMGRGLGFSGAVRVASAALAVAEASPVGAGRTAAGGFESSSCRAILDVAARWEGHGDNAAASVYGGVVAYLGEGVVPLPVGPELADAVVLAWVPEQKTSTDRSRATLSDHVPRADAVHNIGRVVQFAAAVAADRPMMLCGSTDDRLHQAQRLPLIPGAAEVLSASVDAGAWVAWLSGSGPSVACLCDRRRQPQVVEVLEQLAAQYGAHVKVTAIDRRGVRVLPAEL